MSYKLAADTQREVITVTTDESVSPFSLCPGATVLDSKHAEVKFSAEGARFLYDFLRKVDFNMDDATKTFLRILLDGRNHVEGFIWEAELTDLKNTEYAKRGRLRTDWDLLHYLPLRYVDKSNPQKVRELTEGEHATVIGKIVSIKEHVSRVPAVVVTIQDPERIELTAWFFRQSWLLRKYSVDDVVVLSGDYSIRINKFNGTKTAQLVNATINPLDDYERESKVTPIYSEKAGKKKYRIAQDVITLLNTYGYFKDPVPAGLIKKYGFMTRNEAYRAIHAPNTLQEAARARERIAFDDFIRLQVFLQLRKQYATEEQQGFVSADTSKADAFIHSLPFELTGAQRRVVKEIQADMASEHPMSRLIHGEVGSGKTEIALTAALTAVASGGQVAFLAPTSILATQLYDRVQANLQQFPEGEDVSIDLLTSKMKKKEREEIIERVADGSQSILVGTHAILNKEVHFKNLSLIIIDEQHKFGTEHRKALIENSRERDGRTPDMMMMSATPIPRTMAQTVYGDLDVSVIDELPASRKPIITYWDETEEGAWDMIAEQVKQGHQAYVLASLVEESESEMLENVENATATQTLLQTSVFPNLNVGLVHGKLKPAEKDDVLDKFYRNEIQILVSTSVVEVGVNVPNATVMVVLNANRFGIASLHQIRGRVGRGSAQGYCYLIGEATNPEAEQRLSALVASNDGFWLSEQDLVIRGEGSILKNNQHGMNDLLIANLKEYRNLLEIAQQVAKKASGSAKMRAEVELLLGSPYA